MVNVSAIIRKKKRQFYATRDKRRQMDISNREAELKRLRAERVRVEERAKLETARRSERSRIKSAKAKTPSKMMAFGRGVAKVVNKERLKTRKGLQFGGDKRGTAFDSGGSGIQFGGSGGPFGPKPKPKPKTRTVTIVVKS